MKNDLKIKDINNKLIEKYNTNSWSEILVPYFQSSRQHMLFDTLLDNLKEGRKFTPGLKDWYKSFEETDLNNVKLIIVTKNHDSLESGTPIKFSVENTIQLVQEKTCDDLQCHSNLWNPFNEEIITRVTQKLQGTVVLFIGESTYNLGKKADPSAKKFFLPERTHAFWKDEVEVNLFLSKLNIVAETKLIC